MAKKAIAARPPIIAPRNPKRRKWRLELLGDERVRRADEMKDFDDLSIGRHRAARGEPDRRAHRHDHQHEKSGGENDDSIGHGAEARGPHPMVVKIGLRNG